MLQDVIHPPEPLSIEGISSPIAAHILDFCDNEDLFNEPLQAADVPSCSATCTGGAAAPATTTTTTTITTTGSNDIDSFDDGSFASDFSPFPTMDAVTLSALLDPEANIVSGVAPAYPSPPSSAMFAPYIGDHPDQLDQLVLADAMTGGYTSYSPESVVQLPMGPCPPPLPAGYMDPSPSTSCSFLDTGGLGGFYHPGGMGIPFCGAGGEGSGPVGFFGGMLVRPETGMGPQDLVEFQRPDAGGLGIYAPEAIHRVYSSGDMQVIGDGQHLVGGCSTNPAPLPTSDISTLDESTFKVGRLSVEERKEKIHRYLKKRHERNFSKKIKYACRKTLADSRPRVRGRFAKNDEFGEAAARSNTNHHEFDEEEEVVVKEEDTLDSSDILAHISGVNSFKYNYTLESWI